MESREQRITTLATTLRSSGIAKSDSQAKMMAEEMIGVEEHVQKSYEAEHTRAHEYLQTAKNLGDPRVRPGNQDQSMASQSSASIAGLKSENASRKIEPIRSDPKKEFTDIDFGSKTLNQAVSEHSSHDTHNSALESIKAQISGMDSRNWDNHAQTGPEKAPLESRVPAPELSSEVLDAAADPVSTPVNGIKDEIPAEVPCENPQAPQGLDAKKLIDLMEEDGKMEEHTREIKEKPKDAKPKDAYEENTVDLASMFNFNKK